ncbi:MAG: hypothetical protein WB609_05365, partial [Candidatus Cybelea sp.]
MRDRVVGGTRTQRGRSYAQELAPHSEFELVRREQMHTEALRSLIAGADFRVMPAIETLEFTEAAGAGRTLGASDLRATGDALA